MERGGLQADECIVFEDTHIGAVAAKAAGMHVLATTNLYTENEDLSMADLVVNCLGDVDGLHAEIRSDDHRLALADGCVHARDLIDLFGHESSGD